MEWAGRELVARMIASRGDAYGIDNEWGVCDVVKWEAKSPTKMEKRLNGERMTCILRGFKSYKINKSHRQYVFKILSSFGTAMVWLGCRRREVRKISHI